MEFWVPRPSVVTFLRLTERPRSALKLNALKPNPRKHRSGAGLLQIPAQARPEGKIETGVVDKVDLGPEAAAAAGDPIEQRQVAGQIQIGGEIPPTGRADGRSKPHLGVEGPADGPPRRDRGRRLPERRIIDVPRDQAQAGPPRRVLKRPGHVPKGAEVRRGVPAVLRRLFDFVGHVQGIFVIPQEPEVGVACHGLEQLEVSPQKQSRGERQFAAVPDADFPYPPAADHDSGGIDVVGNVGGRRVDGVGDRKAADVDGLSGEGAPPSAAPMETGIQVHPLTAAGGVDPGEVTVNFGLAIGCAAVLEVGQIMGFLKSGTGEGHVKSHGDHQAVIEGSLPSQGRRIPIAGQGAVRRGGSRSAHAHGPGAQGPPFNRAAFRRGEKHDDGKPDFHRLILGIT